jgi:translation initiation factor 5B
MRDKKSKFIPVKEIHAATGVKIVAPDIEDVVAGMPLVQADKDNLEKAEQEVQQQVEEVIIETQNKGIVIKADSLGSLEALIKLLKEEKIPIRKANIGNITKKDISDAASNYESNPLHSVILGFNVVDISGLCDERVNIIKSPIIYEIIQNYKLWIEEEKRKREASAVHHLIQPAKLEYLKGYTFRQSNPAVFGVEIMAGTLRSNTPIMNNQGINLSSVKSIQADKESVEKAERGKQVAISVPNITIGRQVNEGDILYSNIPEQDFKKFKKFKEYLSEDQKMVLKEIAEIKRQDNPVWGI